MTMIGFLVISTGKDKGKQKRIRTVMRTVAKRWRKKISPKFRKTKVKIEQNARVTAKKPEVTKTKKKMKLKKPNQQKE